MRHTVAAAASRRFFSGASFRPSTGHWGSALENFLRADGQGDRRQNDNRKAPIEAPDDSVWVQCQRWCDSETIHSALTNAVCADVTTSSPAMRLVLRKFTDHGGSEVADDTLRKLAESLFLQWKHGFPRTPYGLDQLTHGFYRYPAGMQPASAGLLISGAVLQFIQSGNDTGPSTIKVFDPCCGSGTTLVEVQRAQKSKQLIAGVVDPAMFSKSQAYSDASSSPGTEQTSEDGPHPIRFDPLPTGSTLRSFGNDVSPLAVFVATGQTWQPEASELAAFRALATDIAKIARSKVRLQEAPASQGGGARIEGAFESLRILIDEVGQQIDGCSGAESEALPQESLTNSPDMKGPLSFCFLVATQRGMPLVEAERQAAAKAELKFAPSRKQAKKMKAQLRMNQRRRRKRDGKGAWQKQWGVHNKSGSNNDALHAEDAVDLFESVVAEYCRRLGMLQPFDDNVPGSTESQFTDDVCIAPPVISQASVLEGVETERTNVSGSDLFQCIVTSPPYPAIYDYLSFARHARADFDPESAPDGTVLMFFVWSCSWELYRC